MITNRTERDKNKSAAGIRKQVKRILLLLLATVTLAASLCSCGANVISSIAKGIDKLDKANKATDQANLRGAAAEYMTWALTNGVYIAGTNNVAPPITTVSNKQICTVTAPDESYSVFIEADNPTAFGTGGSVVIELKYYTGPSSVPVSDGTPSAKQLAWSTQKNIFIFGE